MRACVGEGNNLGIEIVGFILVLLLLVVFEVGVVVLVLVGEWRVVAGRPAREAWMRGEVEVSRWVPGPGV